jgi:hypothetical protein
VKPTFPDRVLITTPSSSTTKHPVTGNPVPGPPTVEESPARISQSPVANVGAQIELKADQDTVISFWTILVPAGQAMTAGSIVEEIGPQARKFRIVGDVAERPNHRPKFRAAAARLISDMQA